MSNDDKFWRYLPDQVTDEYFTDQIQILADVNKDKNYIRNQILFFSRKYTFKSFPRSQYMSVHLCPEKLSDFRKSNNSSVKAGYTQKLPKGVSLI